jgi:ABC-2 type transport system ATP-binding protein
MTNDFTIATHGLAKSFQRGSETIAAVQGVDLAVEAGEIFGFLGPNGAGKTTVLRMLTTLLPIDEGEAQVAGYDVRRQPGDVRRHIGYVSQVGGSDPQATARENLILQSQLYGASTSDATRRAGELINLFELESFADRATQTYSGGQRRRLEIALGVVHRPRVLFLDEPTAGLDPQNRANLWEQVRQLRAAGATIFLTTHYLEEADALSDRLAIIDHGRIVASGTPRDLKRQLAGEVISLSPKDGETRLAAAHDALSELEIVREIQIESGRLRLYVEDGTHALPVVFDQLKSLGVELESITLSAPSLDDVFLAQTGRSLRDAAHVDPQEMEAHS